MAALLITIKARNIHERLCNRFIWKSSQFTQNTIPKNMARSTNLVAKQQNRLSGTIIRSVYFYGKNKTIQIRSPHLVRKKRLYDRKNNKDPLGEKQAMKQTAALETKDPNSYIPIYSPKRLGRMDRQQGDRTHYPNVSST